MELTKQDISNTAPGAISIYKIVGLKLEPLFNSKEICTFSNMTEKEYIKFIGDDSTNIIIQEDKEAVFNSITEIVKNKRNTNCLYRIYNKKYKFIWIHAKAKYIGTMQKCPVIIVDFLNTSLETTGQFSLINNAKKIIYVIDEKTQEILFANDFTLEKFNNKPYYQKKCYEYMEDLKAPCPWCKMINSKKNHIEMKDFYLPSRDKWYDVNYRKIIWYGKKAIAIFLTDITHSKKTQLTLEESNESLKSIINNIPVGIAVYKKEGDKITCIAVNPSLSKIKGVITSVPGKKIDNSFYNKTFPSERKFFKTNFLDIFNKGNNVFDYRALNGQFAVEDGTIKYSYVWLHLEGYSTEQSDGAKIAYVCLTDISQEKNAVEEANRIRKVEEEQYTHTIDGILSALPKTISTVHLDLTQNYYSNYHNSVIEEEIPLEYGSVDYLIHFLSSRILNEKTRLEFNEKFNRLSLLNSYKIGQNFLSLDYQHKYSEKTILWETISISIARNPKNEDLEAVLYTVNSEERITLEKINKHIALEEYDNIGTISTLDGTIKFYSRNNFDLTPHAFEKYDDDMRNALPKFLPHSELRDAVRDLTLKNIQENLSTNDCFNYGFTVITKDGKNLRKQLRYSYLDETKLKILFTRTDITDTTKAETKQKAQLEKALADAEKANEMKSVFLSSMSHDIRTPLNGIMGYTDLALKENNLESIKTYLNKIQTSSNSLLLLINDTLDLTRIENGNEVLTPEVINTQKYFDDIITTVKPSMESKKINFIAKIDNTKNLCLKFDRLRMEKVILNLLSNAAKFTPEYGTVKFNIECSHIEKNIAHEKITIQDNGCGMSKDFTSKAFEPFTQERTEATKNIGGSGLGLSIVKRLVQLMNGHIDIVSEQFKGTTFYVYLDLEIASSENSKELENTTILYEVPLVGKKILLCEDNDVNREIATAMLEGQGIIVTQTTNGKEAVEVYRKKPAGTFDIILMDIRMPLMNGYEATKSIRQSKKSDSDIIPIIAMTADAYEADKLHAISVGMNSHISKPIDPNKLFETLRNFC